MRQDNSDPFVSWLWGEFLLLGLLGASLALFVANRSLHTTYQLPELRVVLQTVIAIAAGIIAVLAAVRLAVEGRRLDLLLSVGFLIAAASTVAFSITPAAAGHTPSDPTAWAGITGRLIAWTLIAAAAFAPGRARSRERAIGNGVVASLLLLVGLWLSLRWVGHALPSLNPNGPDRQPLLFTGTLAAQALLNLLALIGFGQRFRAHREDLDRWLALGSTLMLFSSLNFVFTPLLSTQYVSQGDFLRVLAYSVLLVGAWRAIRFAEFGRAVAEERARVAREIHDGLAQYLFALSTHVSMLENGVSPEKMIPRLKEAARSAQQEARFAIMALSSASGTAPFDAALRRYVEFLTADGALEVELDIDKTIRLAPDEQIEVFRIVQEGLGNVRKHANASRAEVVIGERMGERFVTVRDNGAGFDGETTAGGQGLKNIRQRTASIDGDVTLTSQPGIGTALEVVLRTA